MVDGGFHGRWQLGRIVRPPLPQTFPANFVHPSSTPLPQSLRIQQGTAMDGTMAIETEGRAELPEVQESSGTARRQIFCVIDRVFTSTSASTRIVRQTDIDQEPRA